MDPWFVEDAAKCEDAAEAFPSGHCSGTYRPQGKTPGFRSARDGRFIVEVGDQVSRAARARRSPDSSPRAHRGRLRAIHRGATSRAETSGEGFEVAKNGAGIRGGDADDRGSP